MLAFGLFKIEPKVSGAGMLTRKCGMPGMDELFLRFSGSQNASRFSTETRKLRVAPLA